MEVVKQKSVDLLVIGTHGRAAAGKLFLGSVAEQIFRQAGCPVLTVGPSSYEESPVEGSRKVRPFLLATDFGEASLEALAYARSFASHFQTKLIVLHVAKEPTPEGPGLYSSANYQELVEKIKADNLRRLEGWLSANNALSAASELVVEFGSPSEQIIQLADRLKADTIVMGLRHSAHTGMAAHMPWATAYEVVSHAGCPALTVRV